MTLGSFLAKSSHGFFPAQIFHVVLFTGSAFVLLRYEPMEALYLYAGLFIGIALVMCQVLKLGVFIPPRTFIFAWVFYGIAAVRAAEILSTKNPLAGRMACNAVMLIVGSYLLQNFNQASHYRDWQAETRQISRMLAETPAPLLIRDTRKRQPLACALVSSRIQHFNSECANSQDAMQPCVPQKLIPAAKQSWEPKDHHQQAVFPRSLKLMNWVLRSFFPTDKKSQEHWSDLSITMEK